MRSRNIKPGFFKNEILGTSDPLLSMTFAGLWCLADKDGKLEDRQLRIKAEIFPYREKVNVGRYLTELAQHGFIERYTVGNCKIIQIVKWVEHQSPHRTERKSILPDKTVGCEVTVSSPLKHGGNPPDSLIPDSLIPDSLIPDSLIPDSLIPDSKPLAPKLKFSFESGRWENLNGQIERWSEAFPAVNVNNEMKRAAVWFIANPKNKKSNYESFMVKWLTKSQDRAPAGSQSPQPSRPTFGQQLQANTEGVIQRFLDRHQEEEDEANRV